MTAYIAKYCPIQGNKERASKLLANGWRVIVSPQVLCGHEKHLREWGGHYALDNGAWIAHKKRERFNDLRFKALVLEWGRGADFIVAPDIVCGGHDSLLRSRSWLPWLSLVTDTAILIAVQDGMTHEDLGGLFDWHDRYEPGRLGVFLGGSTEWKLATMQYWGAFAAHRDCLFHVGRVNTAKRIALCIAAGATSFDGSSPVQFPSTEPLIRRAASQGDLFAIARSAQR